MSELHRAVALQERLQYLKAKLEEHDFELRAGEKILLVLKSVHERFSVGQVMNFIWRAVRDATAFYVRENTSKTHATNIVPGVQRLAERAVADNWDVKSYGRDRSAPESALSQLLFTAILKLPKGVAAVPPTSRIEDPFKPSGSQDTADA
jgi:ribosome-binding ATPase YchF (GTP1/OBG family)